MQAYREQLRKRQHIQLTGLRTRAIATRTLRVLVCVLSLAVLAPLPAKAQTYAVGADVSFLAKCEQDGVVFKENGQPKDVLAILREHHYNWVRLRIFHDPAAAPDKLPNDLPYTLALARRAKDLGFHILLDLHYSDSWADPGKQPMPAAWAMLKHKQLVRASLRLHARHHRRFCPAGPDARHGAGGQRNHQRHVVARRQIAR